MSHLAAEPNIAQDSLLPALGNQSTPFVVPIMSEVPRAPVSANDEDVENSSQTSIPWLSKSKARSLRRKRAKQRKRTLEQELRANDEDVENSSQTRTPMSKSMKKKKRPKKKKKKRQTLEEEQKCRQMLDEFSRLGLSPEESSETESQGDDETPVQKGHKLGMEFFEVAVESGGQDIDRSSTNSNGKKSDDSLIDHDNLEETIREVLSNRQKQVESLHPRLVWSLLMHIWDVRGTEFVSLEGAMDGPTDIEPKKAAREVRKWASREYQTILYDSVFDIERQEALLAIREIFAYVDYLRETNVQPDLDIGDANAIVSTGSSIPTKVVVKFSGIEDGDVKEFFVIHANTPDTNSGSNNAASGISSPDTVIVKFAAMKKKKAREFYFVNGNTGPKPLRGSLEISSGTPTEDLGPGLSWPPGWTRSTRKRLGGATAGTLDHYWFAPNTKFKLRSIREVRRFLTILKANGGDELLAKAKFRNSNKITLPLKTALEAVVDRSVIGTKVEANLHAKKDTGFSPSNTRYVPYLLSTKAASRFLTDISLSTVNSPNKIVNATINATTISSESAPYLLSTKAASRFLTDISLSTVNSSNKMVSTTINGDTVSSETNFKKSRALPATKTIEPLRSHHYVIPGAKSRGKENHHSKAHLTEKPVRLRPVTIPRVGKSKDNAARRSKAQKRARRSEAKLLNEKCSEKWIQMYHQLLAFKTKHGNLDIPAFGATAFLAGWVKHQRKYCTDPIRTHLLKEIGAWGPTI